ncbi:helix-hairpin-helix domain-containing protein [Undibacterium sp. Jales W-56]|uniref:ComEA family DNA-binding protein n=1 Tax=Undibacterium sp. Jales W-56 TaxID=2897325 RepID=UPI0021CE1308|nr:helix-hairpin-helix domain-containing protein [Undibacterium sp. Jales W-56]MCU6435412.1 helix-hairpin-helix domain-containing protein [Undibacterium sp. Jales W-56]
MNKLLKSILFASMTMLAISAAQAKDEPKKAPASVSASASAKVELLDLNSATKKELSELPKIGDVRSDAIIKGRPYKGKDDLLNKKIIPEDAYNSIKDLVIAKQKTDAKKK